MKRGLVSIVIPTKNSAEFLEDTLISIRDQSYPHIETIVVDSKSTDQTVSLAKKYHSKLLTYTPTVKKGIFDAPHKRNYGMAKSHGEFVYWLDADMTLPKHLIRDAVQLTRKGFGGVILPEDSFGVGMWASAKQLERRCYWGDGTVESPRFFTKYAWDDIGGFDLSLGAGGDDIDLTHKLIEKGYAIGRTKLVIRHNEGRLSIIKLFKKRFMYGREMINYFHKRPKSWLASYNPLKVSYAKNWKLFLSRPIDTLCLVVMRIIEYTGGGLGFVYALWQKNEKNNALGTQEPLDYSDVSSQYYGVDVPRLLTSYLGSVSWQSILDLGCGDGSLLFALKQHGYFRGKRVYAVDLSPKSIALVSHIDARIHAYVDNVEAIKRIQRGSIDFCVSTMVIEHVDDVKMLRSLDRVLKRNGYAYITTVFKKPYGWYFYRRNGVWVMDVTHQREYTRDQELFDRIDTKKFTIVESRKRLIWFPFVDFFVRRLHISDRSFFARNPLFLALRSLTVPILGYYEWEIVLQKK